MIELTSSHIVSTIFLPLIFLLRFFLPFEFFPFSFPLGRIVTCTLPISFPLISFLPEKKLNMSRIFCGMLLACITVFHYCNGIVEAGCFKKARSCLCFCLRGRVFCFVLFCFCFVFWKSKI